MRAVGKADVPELVGLMCAFYAEGGFGLDEDAAAAGFRTLLDEPRLGRVWLLERHGGVAGGVSASRDLEQVVAPPAGYVVVTFAFAIEYGDMVAVVDDFYVRPEARGEGLGTAALAAVRQACEDHGVRALRVEVGEDNTVALAVYRSAGFERLAGHAVMALPLEPPLSER